MEAGDIATWAGVAVAIAFGLFGMIVGISGNRRAKEANDLAKGSNEIARDASDAATQANEIAKGANELSEEANAVARRALSRQEEDWFVDWTLDWQSKEASIALLNAGRHGALEVNVTVVAPDIHLTETSGSVSPGQSYVVHVPEFAEQRAQDDRQRGARIQAFRASGISYFPGQFHAVLKVTVSWKTGLGFPERRQFEINAT